MNTPVKAPDVLGTSWPTLGDDGAIRHMYPASLGRRPRPGDVALCGHVKRRPTTFPSNAAARASGVPMCAACARIDEAIA